MTLTIEVVYAPQPQEQCLLRLAVPSGTTALAAVTNSGLLQRYPELNMHPLSLGVFGKAVSADTILRSLDRVEIYRPLLDDPKEIRRRRAQLQKHARARGTGP